MAVFGKLKCAKILKLIVAIFVWVKKSVSSEEIKKRKKVKLFDNASA